VLKVSHLGKSFGGRAVLKDVSLNLQPGEIIFVLGISGTGKSVLLKLLVGLLKPDSGKIEFHGDEVTSKSEADWSLIRRKIGMVFQQPALFDSLTVFENLAFGLRRLTNLNEAEIENKVRTFLGLVQIDCDLQSYPSSLSYGTQKRLSFARTAILEPEVLLFDEPTTGLDPLSTYSINNLILKMSRELKVSSIIVSHDMECALAIADRIIVLDQGAVLWQGPRDQIRQSGKDLINQFLSDLT
jgi:phospholipid/cholesterol/gamma-HCH transport system ATP-binding protein